MVIIIALGTLWTGMVLLILSGGFIPAKYTNWSISIGVILLLSSGTYIITYKVQHSKEQRAKSAEVVKADMKEERLQRELKLRIWGSCVECCVSADRGGDVRKYCVAGCIALAEAYAANDTQILASCPDYMPPRLQ